jgi:hypothetical protein
VTCERCHRTAKRTIEPILTWPRGWLTSPTADDLGICPNCITDLDRDERAGGAKQTEELLVSCQCGNAYPQSLSQCPFCGEAAT